MIIECTHEVNDLSGRIDRDIADLTGEDNITPMSF